MEGGLLDKPDNCPDMLYVLSGSPPLSFDFIPQITVFPGHRRWVILGAILCNPRGMVMVRRGLEEGLFILTEGNAFVGFVILCKYLNSTPYSLVLQF
jgi:hypothetical protein